MSAPMPPPPPPMTGLKLGAPTLGNCKFLTRNETTNAIEKKNVNLLQKSIFVHDLPQENHPTQLIQGQLSCKAFKKERN